MEAETLNYPAVLLGAALAFALGFALYHPKTLGGIWARGSGVEMGQSPPPLAFVTQVAALLALAVVVGMTATVNFLGTALLAILAAALFVSSQGAFSGKSTGAILVDAGYILGAGALMIVAQGVL